MCSFLLPGEWAELSGVSECHFIRNAAGNVADFPLFYSMFWTVAKLFYCRVQNSLHILNSQIKYFAEFLALLLQFFHFYFIKNSIEMAAAQATIRPWVWWDCTAWSVWLHRVQVHLHQDTQIPSPEMPTLIQCSVFSVQAQDHTSTGIRTMWACDMSSEGLQLILVKISILTLTLSSESIRQLMSSCNNW